MARPATLHPYTGLFRNAFKRSLVLLVCLAALYCIHRFFLPLLALVFPSLDPACFDLGVYGAYPTTKYASFHLPGPRARHMRWDDTCDQGLLLLTPNGPSIPRPLLMILDAQGGLVWMNEDFGESANLQVQRFRGQNYLTFWSGNKLGTWGGGFYHMMDSTYQVVRNVSAVGDGLLGDLHEFKITHDDTALLAVYNTTKADLTGMGMWRSANDWVADNLFQEVDLETGELLFQWSALDHFDPVDTYMTNPLGGYLQDSPFDWYHINSVDKDSQGNYLISSRHFHHVACISPEGETLWVLGGRHNQFEDLSDGQATNFKWQHDARWHSEKDGILTLLDNSKAGLLHNDAPYSRAMFIQLDIPNRTAKLLQSLTSLQHILSSSQGDVQVLPENGHRFVGWGSAAAYSEYSQGGDLLCETHLGASWFYWLERFKTYRTIKTFEWHGEPRSPPQVKIEDDLLFVSWNGATNVAYWSLELDENDSHHDSDKLRRTDEHDSDSGAFYTVDVIPKAGFEGSFGLPTAPTSDKSRARYRVAALDSTHVVLRYSDVIEYRKTPESSALLLGFTLFLIVGFLAGARLILMYCRSGNTLRGEYRALSPPLWVGWKSPTSWWRLNPSELRPRIWSARNGIVSRSR